MKVLYCSEIRLGAECTEELDEHGFEKWQKARMKKFRQMLEEAKDSQTDLAVLCGQLFGTRQISSSMIRNLCHAVKHAAPIRVLALMETDEFVQIEDGEDLPDNLLCLPMLKTDSFAEDGLQLDRQENQIHIDDQSQAVFSLEQTSPGTFIMNTESVQEVIPFFEPAGSIGLNGRTFGWAYGQWQDRRFLSWKLHEDQTYKYESIEIEAEPDDTEKSVVEKILAAAGSDPEERWHTFAKIRLSGTTSFGLVLNTANMEKALKKQLFAASIADDTKMMRNKAGQDQMHTMLAEFCRLVLNDPSLTEKEKDRVISCGCSFLERNGGELQ